MYVSVDGITNEDRLERTYIKTYDVPAGFYEEISPEEIDKLGENVYNATDFGAVADSRIDNREFIQNAIDAAHLNGGGIVFIPEGTYGIRARESGPGGIWLKNNVFLKGAGIGKTNLRVVDGHEGKLTGIVRTPREMTYNYGLADLTLDGNRDNTTGKVDGYYSGGIPGGLITDEDATILRVEAKNNKGYGFDPHERTKRLQIKDCVAHGNGLDGFVADFIIDGEYINNLAYGNDRHGFNICTTTNDFLLKDNIARSNYGGGIVIQRGSEYIPSPSNILISGGISEKNSRDGILVQMSSNVRVEDVSIKNNGTYGVRLYGSNNVEVVGNRIINSSASGDGKYAGVQIREDEDIQISGGIYTAQNNLIQNNRISWDEGKSGSYGIHERGNIGYEEIEERIFVQNNEIKDNTIKGVVRSLFLNAPDSQLKVSHTGSIGSDDIEGTQGDDTLNGGKGNDIIFGDNGADIISGNTGSDMLYGGGDDDQISGNDGDDTIWGEEGSDILNGGKGEDLIYGGSDNDLIKGETGADELHGGNGDDEIYGKDGYDLIYGDAGLDIIYGGRGNDEIYGGENDDYIEGNRGSDFISGEDGNDTVFGNDGDDLIKGGSGNDGLNGGKGIDTLFGGDGNDTIRGNSGWDKIYGGIGADILFGDSGNDELYGGDDNDEIYGGSGTDLIEGGLGNDTISTGSGWDNLYIREEFGNDIVTDFVTRQDQIFIDNTVIETRQQLLESMITFNGSSTKINFGENSSLIIEGILPGDFAEKDFVFI